MKRRVFQLLKCVLVILILMYQLFILSVQFDATVRTVLGNEMNVNGYSDDYTRGVRDLKSAQLELRLNVMLSTFLLVLVMYSGFLGMKFFGRRKDGEKEHKEGHDE